MPVTYALCGPLGCWHPGAGGLEGNEGTGVSLASSRREIRTDQFLVALFGGSPVGLGEHCSPPGWGERPVLLMLDPSTLGCRRKTCTAFSKVPHEMADILLMMPYFYCS